MELNEYQAASHKQESWHPRGSEDEEDTTDEVAYNTVALCNEAGEFADVSSRNLCAATTTSTTRERARPPHWNWETCSGILARLADELGYPLEQVAAMNLQKIGQRKALREQNESAFQRAVPGGRVRHEQPMIRFQSNGECVRIKQAQLERAISERNGTDHCEFEEHSDTWLPGRMRQARRLVQLHGKCVL